MGSKSAVPVREAPVRFVATQLPRLDKTPVEVQFKKPQYTAEGINRRLDDVNTEPLMYVETSKDASGTELTDHTAPRWYLNTYMEMIDNQRTDQVVISGNLPLSWERDKFEPYSLVRGRIDDEDLRWVLSAENRKKSVDELLEFTKLERHVLQDILDTVELPRTQYRNYKGKLHKSIDDANTHMAARKVQVERARETETLRRIGYTEEEVEREEQYLTNRPRGVKALDDLGASVREKRRNNRAAEASELEDMLEERRVEQIERGEAVYTEEELVGRPEELSIKPKPFGVRKTTYKHMYAADMGKDGLNQAKFQWWLDRTRRIKRAVDTIHGVPVYNERLSANEEQTRKQMREAAEFNFSLSQAQGAKGFTDPRGHYDDFMSILRTNKDSLQADMNVEVHDDGVSVSHDIYRYPHTAGHAEKPPEHVFKDKRQKAEPLDVDFHNLESFHHSVDSGETGAPSAFNGRDLSPVNGESRRGDDTSTDGSPPKNKD